MLSERKTWARSVRHLRIRAKVQGTPERPRLAVFRSLSHIYAQLIDDTAQRTMVSADSRVPELKGRIASGGNVAAAKVVGELLAARAKARGIERVVFDRGGYQYHGRVKALAEGARAGGLQV
jgi:large subunit ribosomal protein L18